MIFNLLTEQDILALRRVIDASRRIMAFTGAGVSEESGIPTYRGHGGTWTKYDPEKYASIDYFRRDPSYFWRFFREVRMDIMSKAQPNGAHLALVELERRGRLSAVVTQNIDGLHQRAGSQQVYELHGNTTRFYCTRCREYYDLDTIRAALQKEDVPHCGCSGVLRPDVVLFGEFLPEFAMERAIAEAQACDLCLVIGSSLVVYPAANIPLYAKQAGAQLAIINIDPTPLDDYADLVLNTPAAELLAKAVEVQENR